MLRADILWLHWRRKISLYLLWIFLSFLFFPLNFLPALSLPFLPSYFTAVLSAGLSPGRWSFLFGFLPAFSWWPQALLAPTSSAEGVHKLITYRSTTMRKWDSGLWSLQPQSILGNTQWQRRVSFISPQGKGHSHIPLASLYSIWPFRKKGHWIRPCTPSCLSYSQGQAGSSPGFIFDMLCDVRKATRSLDFLPKPVRIQPEDLLCTWPQVQSSSRSCLNSGN